jgi:hypothetical protein
VHFIDKEKRSRIILSRFVNPSFSKKTNQVLTPPVLLETLSSFKELSTSSVCIISDSITEPLVYVVNVSFVTVEAFGRKPCSFFSIVLRIAFDRDSSFAGDESLNKKEYDLKRFIFLLFEFDSTSILYQANRITYHYFCMDHMYKIQNNIFHC